MADALEMAEYFRAHAQRVMTHFGAAPARHEAFGTRLLAILLSAGTWITRTSIHDELGRNAKAADLDVALSALADEGLAEGGVSRDNHREGRAAGDGVAQSTERINEETKKPARMPVLSFFRSFFRFFGAGGMW